MKIETLKPRMVVYEVRRQRMGNTTMRTTCVFDVRIVSVDADKGVVRASWNGNPARDYYRRTWSKWRLKEPVMIRSPMGWARLATRAEIKAMRLGAQEGAKDE